MEKAKKLRAMARTMFTKSYKHLKALPTVETADKEEIKVAFQWLEEKARELETAEQAVLDAMIDQGCDDDLLNSECEAAEEYRIKFIRIRMQVATLFESHAGPATVSAPIAGERRKKYRLPEIELPKFTGEVRGWLTFWGQYKKIHEDDEIPREDKFQYLIQAMETGSRAQELVLSFPPTADNYEKVINSLKKRFGKEEVLVEVYVRELLKLVLNNAMRSDDKVQLVSLYDKLETHLRALESLGVTTDKCAAMLFPLVESSLPEDLLRAWQRGNSDVSRAVSKDRLTGLMTFLQTEVDNEQRIAMAVNGFNLNNEKEKTKKIRTRSDNFKDVPTATGLLTTKAERTPVCVFCSSDHENTRCDVARKLTLEEKNNILKRNNCCFLCLRVGHIAKRCRVPVKCAWCGRKHNILMCTDVAVKPEKSTKSTEPKSRNINENNLANMSSSPQVLLQTLYVKLRNENEEVEVRAIIDSGSQRSYILRDTAKRMGYDTIDEETVTHSLFGGVKSEAQKHNVYMVRLMSKDDKYACKFKVLDQKVICSTIPNLNVDSCLKELDRLKIKLTDVGKDFEPIQVLIGADVAGKIMTGRRHILKCGLVALETTLGWTLMGKVPHTEEQYDTATMLNSLFVMQARVSDLWELDVIGITDPTESKNRAEREREVKDNFFDTAIINKDGRYEVQLPWIENHPSLPSNESLARGRLTKLTSRLKHEGNFEKYDKVLQDWLAEGIIEKVPDGETAKYGHYIPHRHVIKENSTTKLRPVFDASAKVKNAPSLNQCLEKGPNLIELIPTILLKFRKERYGVVSDIKQAFLQISITARDRDYLRFLWWVNDELQMYRHCRVVFGVSCSPFLLGAVIDLHLQKSLDKARQTTSERYSIDTITRLRKSFYVDNCVTSISSEETLHRFIRESTNVMCEAGFDLRGWEFSADNGANELTSVLGLLWNRFDDTLTVNRLALSTDLPEVITKRKILAIAHRVYDPIGFLCPVMLCPKLLLQETWADGNDWDAPVKEDVKIRFLDWYKDLPKLERIKIPRWIFGPNFSTKDTTFHVFCDASRTAYAAVMYARCESNCGTNIQLVAAKARVAPLKEITIPRLELLAALIGSRLAVSSLEALEIENAIIYMWTDSTTVLSWIQRDAPWGVFVANRVQEIRRLISTERWRHVPGEKNPADIPSRGCSVTQLWTKKWWEGPAWLKDVAETWPSTTPPPDETRINEELRKCTVNSLLCGRNEMSSDRYVKNFSSYYGLLKFVAWTLRFVYNCRATSEERHKGLLTVDELVSAETKILKMVQDESFSGENDPKLGSLKLKKTDDGLLQLQTSISTRQDTSCFRYPVILPSQHEVVRLLVRETHEKMCHAGVLILLGQLRERFWILRGRRTIRSIISKCVVCRRHQTKPLVSVPVALPLDRVRDAAVFEVTGVDFAGPIYLRGGEKAWICLFTCAVYRAVHLELVTSLSTLAFIEALRRFIARRGRPTTIYSDNGTNFVGTDKLFEKVNWEKVVGYSASQRVQWKFNPPSAAWWGGWWERLIRILKQLLRRVLGRASLSYEEMVTILCDCEAIMNSRPITYLSEDSEDLTPLTPALLLQQTKDIGVPDCDAVTRSSLVKRVRYQHKLREVLRERFRREYLSQLVLRKKRGDFTGSVKVGDVVIVGNDNDKRLDWPLARVKETIIGRDGHIRVVRLKTATGELLRPIQRVYPLEIDASDQRCAIERTVTKRGRVVRQPIRYC